MRNLNKLVHEIVEVSELFGFTFLPIVASPSHLTESEQHVSVDIPRQYWRPGPEYGFE